MSLRHDLFRLGGVVVLLALAIPALAIKPGMWDHNTEADFDAGERDSTVVTNLGDIKLSRLTESLGEMPEDVSVIYDLEQVGDVLYIAAGPEAKLLAKRGDAIEQVAALANEQVFALSQFDGKLLAAISGASSRLAVLDGEELRTVAQLADVRYIWEVIVDGPTIYAATGTEGKVLAIRPDRFDAEQENNPGLTVVLDAKQANVLSLGRDQQGRLYAGTDEDGLIFRLTPTGNGTWDTFVLFDAPEPEIGAILVTKDGTVYAGTSDANQARPGRLEAAVSNETGRPQPPAEAPKTSDNGEGGDAPADEKPEPPVNPEPAPMNDDAPAPAVEEPGSDAPVIETPPVPVPGPVEPAPQPMQAGNVDDKAKEQPADASAGGAEVTAEQRDQLREVIRQRLLDARRSGALQAGPGDPVQPQARPAAQQRPRPATGPQRGQRQARPGNAIYRIDDQGFVREVFRESVMVLRIVEQNGHLLVATGNEGQIFRLNPVTGETTVLLDLESDQVPVIQSPGGNEGSSLLIAAANPALVMRLEPSVARQGTFTSAALDAGQISLWGKLNITADVPEGSELRVETRSGNVEDPEQGPWSNWSQPQVIAHNESAHALQPRALSITSPPGRFLQYRLTLVAGDETSPVVDRVAIAYVVPNLPPVVASLQAKYPETPARPARPGQPAGGDSGIPDPKPNVTVEWQASDPNEDRLRYTLEYQPSGSSRWLPLKENLEQNNFEWNTRQAPDGWYSLRVTASDHLDNPPEMAQRATRKSAPVLVDNTPPTLETAIQRPERVGDVVIQVDARDALSVIQSARYAVDATDQWQPLLPVDLIFDSTHERLQVKITGLAPGSHLVVLSVSDAQGNTAFKHVFVEVE